MTKFTATNVQQKTSSTGKPMWGVDLRGEDGVITKIMMFESVTEGQELNGELYVNDKGYTNFKSAQKVAGANFAGAKKDESIQKAQERTSAGVANAGSITNATNLVTAMIDAGIISKEFSTETDIKNKVREYITWYRELYNNPQAVAPF